MSAQNIPPNQPIPLPQDVERELLALAVNFSEDAIMITTTDLDDPGPTIIYANPAFLKMTGYSREEAFGRSPRFLQGPRTDWNVLKDMRKVLESGNVFYGSVYNYRKDGTEFVNEWHIEPIKDDRGAIIYYLSIQRDITQRRRLEDELRAQKIALEEKNVALREVLEQIEIEKKKIKDNVIKNVQDVFLPAFKKLKRKGSPFDKKYLDVLEIGLEDLASSFGGKMAALDARLSPRETEIANLVRNGLNNKEIGAALNLSVKTVETHRSRIRSKLKLTKKSINLTSYLTNI
ncbi:MAG: PAS domain-containing protein [Candidatus Omnitrophica bacterium]|nr:PAS domain-containing protein [Candidatus Omnitrophota bacterium]